MSLIWRSPIPWRSGYTWRGLAPSTTIDERYRITWRRYRPRLSIPAKDPAEVISLTWDFSRALDPLELVSAAQITIALDSGAAAQPLDLIHYGLIVDHPLVHHYLSGGVHGATYLVRCQATLAPSGRILILAATLPVRTA